MSLVFEKVVEILCERLSRKREEITLETAFAEDLNLDSLDLAALLMEFEDEFDLSIPEGNGSLRTVGDAVKYLEAKLAKRGW